MNFYLTQPRDAASAEQRCPGRICGRRSPGCQVARPGHTHAASSKVAGLHRRCGRRRPHIDRDRCDTIAPAQPARPYTGWAHHSPEPQFGPLRRRWLQLVLAGHTTAGSCACRCTRTDTNCGLDRSRPKDVTPGCKHAAASPPGSALAVAPVVCRRKQPADVDATPMGGRDSSSNLGPLWPTVSV